MYTSKISRHIGVREISTTSLTVTRSKPDAVASLESSEPAVTEYRLRTTLVFRYPFEEPARLLFDNLTADNEIALTAIEPSRQDALKNWIGLVSDFDALRLLREVGVKGPKSVA